jgi:hypothetical protein
VPAVFKDKEDRVLRHLVMPFAGEVVEVLVGRGASVKTWDVVVDEDWIGGERGEESSGRGGWGGGGR